MQVLAFGTYDAARHPRVSVLIEGLRGNGVTVVECNVPLRLDTHDRVRMLRQPWRLPLLAFELLRAWTRLLVASRGEHPDVVLVGYLGHFDVMLAKLRFPGVPVVHDMLVFASDTARDRGAGRLRQQVLRCLDVLALRCSDVLVLDTEEHRLMLPEDRLVHSVVVPVGASTAWFAPEPQPRATPPTAVFFGLYTPLQGAKVIGEALPRLTGIEVTMIGSGQDLAATRRAAREARVTWLEWSDPTELPAVVREHDVCLGIFSAEGKGTRVVPTKVYQGLAAGCAVVTSDTAPQRRALGEAAVLVPPGDPDALVEALQQLADDPDRLLALRRAGWRLARSSYHPEAVVLPLLDTLRRMGSHNP